MQKSNAACRFFLLSVPMPKTSALSLPILALLMIGTRSRHTHAATGTHARPNTALSLDASDLAQFQYHRFCECTKQDDCRTASIARAVYGLEQKRRLRMYAN